MEYDIVAEKIYTLPSREELEQLSQKVTYLQSRLR